MQLYLVRHAESENNAKPVSLRVEDPPITSIGRLQAEYLASWLKTLKINTLICSPVRRAIETTRFIATATGNHVHVWADIFEEGGIYRGHGSEANEGGPGLSRADVMRLLTDDLDACTLDDTIVETGWWASRPRETPEQAEDRARFVKDRLVNTFGSNGATVVAVIHADFKRRLLFELVGQQIDTQSLGFLRNTGITKIDFDGQRWKLDWFNSVSHLPHKLITSHEQ